MVMLGDGGEAKNGTNINFFLEENGINVNEDAVVRTVYYKYHHPKEVYIGNGVVNREINRQCGKRSGKDPVKAGKESSVISKDHSLAFVYPYGASLGVQKPAFPILSSGHIAFPLNRPVVAACQMAGRLLVLGSMHIVHDAWVEEQENGKLMDVL